MKKIEVKIIREQHKYFEQQMEMYLNKGYEIQSNIFVAHDGDIYALLTRKK